MDRLPLSFAPASRRLFAVHSAPSISRRLPNRTPALWSIALLSTHAPTLASRRHRDARTLATTAPPLSRATAAAAAPPPAAAAAPVSTPAESTEDDPLLIYTGPLAPTFRRLKIFSLSSLGLSIALSPFIFLIQSSLPLSARLGLAGIAIGTSGVSTGLVSWCGRPYVTALRRLPPSAIPAPAPDNAPAAKPTSAVLNDNAGIELHTLTLAMRKRITRLYDPAFLTDASRPFAKWELAAHVQLPDNEKSAVTPGMEETVAETLDDSGRVLGRWVVLWGEDGKGECLGIGRIQR
ncbi:hypothetical protein DENSPDRAFT_836175 [Dentipellis sp. KUC8613]|nr:hypothetical protein DENSPDRAFT_836175 [Dentipellis sp. KUC8613]